MVIQKANHYALER